MASGGSGGTGESIGGGVDPAAWHKGGDAIGAATVLGSTTPKDVIFIWNGIEVCHLGWELELPDKDYYYLKFNRSTNQGQYVQCLQEQSQGNFAYVAIELTNLDGTGAVFADHDIGVAGHGFVEPFPTGIEADDLFITSNKKLLLEGTIIKFYQRLSDIAAQECFRIDDGTTAPIGATGGIVHFTRDSAPDGAVFLVAKNLQSAGVMEMYIQEDVASLRLGASGSTNPGYHGIIANEAYVFGVAGGLCLVTNTPNPIRLLTDEIVRYVIDGAGNMAWFGASPVPQQAAIPDAAGGSVIDVQARAAVNALLAANRNYALIKT